MRMTEEQYAEIVASRRKSPRAEVPADRDPFSPEALAAVSYRGQTAVVAMLTEPIPPKRQKASTVSKRHGSQHEAELALQIGCNELPAPRIQANDWHPVRKWSFDFYWPEHKLAAEVDGGLYVNGRHNRGAAMEEQYLRDQEAALQGIRVLRFSPKQVKSGRAVEVIRTLLKGCLSLTQR